MLMLALVWGIVGTVLGVLGYRVYQKELTDRHTVNYCCCEYQYVDGTCHRGCPECNPEDKPCPVDEWYSLKTQIAVFRAQVTDKGHLRDRSTIAAALRTLATGPGIRD